MERFLSISPSPLLAPYVKEYWFLSADSTCQGKQRAIPSGYAGLIFNRGGNIYSEEYGLYPKSYLFGQSVRPVNMCFDNLNIVIVVFQPIGIKMLLNMSGSELKGQNVGLDLLSPRFKELEIRLLDTPDEQRVVCLIENVELQDGTQIISNNFIDDMDKGNYMTLAPEEDGGSEAQGN